MKIIEQGTLLRGAGIQRDTFDGDARFCDLHKWESAATDSVSHVTFHDGACTKWHEHEGGQLLVVTHGVGFVETADDGRFVVEVGDVVIAQPGERHRHGAAPGSKMSHLAVSRGTVLWCLGPR